MGKQAFDAKRTQIWWFDPDQLVIIGLDTDDGPEHELYDERIHLPLGEAFIVNVMEMGVLSPISIRKNGDTAEVNYGRRRVRAAREANKRLKAKGAQTLLVPCKLDSGDASKLLGMIITENEQREGDTPLAKARKIAKLMDFGNTERDAAVMFGVSTTTIRNYLALLDLAPPVQQMVEKGKLSASAAGKLSKLKREEQQEAADKLLDSGQGTTAGATRAVKAKNSGSEAPTIPVPTKHVLKRVIKNNADLEEEEQLPADFVRGVRFALGDLSPASIKGLTAMMEKK